MTRLEKSDAQLDAEAEARRRALDLPRLEHGMDDPDALDPPAFRPTPPPLPPAQLTALRWYIVDLRRAFRYEIPDRLHQSHTSKTPGDELDAKGWTAYPDEGGVGLPFSARMHRYLRTNAGRSSKHQWDMGPDPRTRPAMASIQEVSEWCAPRHTSHQRPHQTRTLCAQLVFEVGYLGQEPDDLAWLHDLDLPTVEKMLLHALRKAYEWRNDTEQRLSREPGSETPLPERRPYRPAA